MWYWWPANSLGVLKDFVKGQNSYEGFEQKNRQQNRRLLQRSKQVMATMPELIKEVMWR